MTKLALKAIELNINFAIRIDEPMHNLDSSYSYIDLIFTSSVTLF